MGPTGSSREQDQLEGWEAAARGRREGCAGSGLRNLPGQPDSGSKLFLSVFSYEANVTKSVRVFIEEEDTTGVCELAVSEPVTRKPRTSAPWKAGRPADKRALADAGRGSAVRSRTVGCLGRKARLDPTTVKSQCGAQQVTETSSDQGRTSGDPGFRMLPTRWSGSAMLLVRQSCPPCEIRGRGSSSPAVPFLHP